MTGAPPSARYPPLVGAVGGVSMKLSASRYPVTASVATAQAAEIVLRDYQSTMVDEARAHVVAKVKRVLIQAPCGAGKTVIGSAIIRNAYLNGRTVFFLVHREELAKQAARTFRQFGIPHSFIMAQYTMSRTERVFVAMIDTLRNRLDKVPVPGLILVDECHHAASPSWRKVLDYFAERGAVIIGLSATPARLDGRPLNDIFSVMVPGPSVKDLIAWGNLSQYDYYLPPQVADLSGVRTLAGDYDKKELAERMDKPQVVGDAIEHYKRFLGGKRAIVFAVSIKHSMHVVEQFRAAGVPAEHVDGEMDSKDRSAAIARFEAGETLVLSNCSLFGEGFDIKACEGVILLRATQSLSLHIQMVGRAMRPHESKERAIILDHVGNVKRHGLPDDDHEWSLEGRKKKGRKKKDEEDDGPKVAQCPKCYTAHAPAPVCPKCGHLYEPKGRREMEQVEGALVKITPEMRAEIAAQRKAEVGKARTLEDLLRIEKERGYKPGWAHMTHNARAKKKAFGRRPEPPLSVYEDDFRRYSR